MEVGVELDIFDIKAQSLGDGLPNQQLHCIKRHGRRRISRSF
jgi:hypothetical protein